MLNRSLRTLETVASWLEKFSLGVAVFLLLAMFGFMLYSIIARYAANRPLIWSEELLSFFFSYSIFIILGAVVRSDQHIRIGFFLEKIAGEQRAKHIWTTLENLIGLGVTAFFAYTAYQWTATSYTTGEKEFTHFIENFYPVWTGKVLPTVGMCFLSFFYFERCIKQLLGFVASKRGVISADNSVHHDYQPQPGKEL
ncbi:MAG: TRAP transporter small permease subunit [Dehalococcoidia bacterium]|nr:MAG: TRAP transporter small permease subunit [Dehalococcoidia bacterium]